MQENWFSQEDLTVSIHTNDVSHQGVVIETMQVEGGRVRVVVDFPIRHSPSVPIGSDAALVFAGVSLDTPLQVSGTVYKRSEDHFRHRYLFEFDKSEVAPLGRAVNQRDAPRVAPDKNGKVEIFLVAGDEHVLSELHNISATGVSVVISRESEAKLYAAWDLELHFELPGQEDSLTMMGIVRSRRRHNDSIMYAIEFDPSNSENFADCQERITDYVMTCQSEDFKRARVVAKKNRGGTQGMHKTPEKETATEAPEPPSLVSEEPSEKPVESEESRTLTSLD
jgi:hypothetical protein